MSDDQLIVLIDDNEVDNYLHEEIVKRSGLQVACKPFDSAVSALTWFDQAPRSVNLIFLDINMPNMNGFEFLERYRELPEDYREGAVIVMLTSSNREADIRRAQSLGANHTNKPLSIETFREIAKEYGID